MKFNLKNRPTKDLFDEKEQLTIKSYELWLEGFEKELQEKLEFEENQAKKPDREQSMVAHFQIDLIKEILGE
jgi:hypothetical protein